MADTQLKEVIFNQMTYQQALDNIDALGEKEFIFLEDKSSPIPTDGDNGKVIVVDNGTFALGDIEIEIEDTLESSSTTAALSANQGRVLNEKITQASKLITEIISVDSSTWESDLSISGRNYSAAITLENVIDNTSFLTLINNNIEFAKYGFWLAGSVENGLKIYSALEPTESFDFSIKIEKYEGEPEPTPTFTDPSSFIFNGSGLTGFVGSETEISIPSSYSILTSEETVIGQAFNYEFMTIGINEGTVLFSSVTFCKLDGTGEITYNGDASAFTNDFEEGNVLLKSATFASSSTAANIFWVLDEPIKANDSSYSTQFEFLDYINLNGITSLNFAGIYEVTSFVIGNDYEVNSIGNNAFNECISLTNVIIPDTVSSIGEFAFSGCSGLTNVTIPDSVTSIGNYAFYACYSLTSISIPNNVTSIGVSAFQGCGSLTSMIIPGGVTTIQWQAFADCTSIIEYDLTAFTTPTSIPTLDVTNVFDGINPLCKFYVSSQEMYDAFITATNWSTYIDYFEIRS